MINLLMNSLAIFGGCVIALLIGSFLGILLDTIKTSVLIRYHKHKIKHRFEKEPRAECYCIDCEKWYQDEQHGYCTYNGQHVSEDYFCKYASIRKDRKC